MIEALARHWLALLLLGGYLLFLLLNARRANAESRDMTDYFVGGRRLSGWVVGVSFCATFASTNSYVGHAGKGYTLGAPWLLFPVFMVLFTWLSWTTVAPRLREFTASLDALTLPDYLARRYDSALVGRTAALIVLFASVLYLIAIFKGAGNVLQVFLAVEYEVAVVVTLVIVVAYTSIGGFLSVARTDVLQGVMMLLGSVLIGYFVFSRAFELTAAPISDPAASGSLFDGMARITADVRVAPLLDWNAGLPLAILVGIFLSGSLKLLVDPRQVSRFFSLADQRAVRTGMLVALVTVLLIQFGLFPVGVLAHLFFDQVGDTDMIVPMLLQREDVFPFWAGDVLLVAIISAAMSSMDSVLLVAASVLSRDLMRVRAVRGVRVTRLAIVGLALVSALLALRPPGDIVGITIFSGSLYAACFLPALLFSLHWSRGHAPAVLGSMLVGVVVLVVWIVTAASKVVHEVFPALIASTLVYVALSLWLPAPRPGAARLVADDSREQHPGRTGE